MNRDEMIRAVEGEIARLKQVRDLLLESTSERFEALEGESSGDGRKPRALSTEARGRIAEAQKRRWAKERGEKGLGTGGKSPGA